MQSMVAEFSSCLKEGFNVLDQMTYLHHITSSSAIDFRINSYYSTRSQFHGLPHLLAYFQFETVLTFLTFHSYIEWLNKAHRSHEPFRNP